jgi:hypothetical protein
VNHRSKSGQNTYCNYLPQGRERILYLLTDALSLDREGQPVPLPDTPALIVPYVKTHDGYSPYPYESPLSSISDDDFHYGMKALILGGFTPAIRIILDMKAPNVTDFVGLWYHHSMNENDFQATSSVIEGDFTVDVINYKRKGSRAFPPITNMGDYFKISPKLFAQLLYRFTSSRDYEHPHTLLFEYWCAYTFVKNICSIPSLPPLNHNLASWLTLLSGHKIHLTNPESEALEDIINKYNAYRTEVTKK